MSRCIDAEGHEFTYARFCWRCGQTVPKTSKVGRSKVGKHLRAAVYYRDNFTCQACGVRPVVSVEGIEYLHLWMKGPSPLRSYDGTGMVMVELHTITFLTLDHIYPHSLGGPTTVGNLQTLCGPCNSRKGAKV